MEVYIRLFVQIKLCLPKYMKLLIFFFTFFKYETAIFLFSHTNQFIKRPVDSLEASPVLEILCTLLACIWQHALLTSQQREAIQNISIRRKGKHFHFQTQSLFCKMNTDTQYILQEIVQLLDGALEIKFYKSCVNIRYICEL